MAINLCRPLQGLRKALCAGANHHEVLHINASTCMCATAKYLNLRHGKASYMTLAQVNVQGHVTSGSHGVRNGHRN